MSPTSVRRSNKSSRWSTTLTVVFQLWDSAIRTARSAWTSKSRSAFNSAVQMGIRSGVLLRFLLLRGLLRSIGLPWKPALEPLAGGREPGILSDARILLLGGLQSFLRCFSGRKANRFLNFSSDLR